MRLDLGDQPGLPLIRDVTFRVAADGAMLGLDFECMDGKTRSLAIPVGALPVMMAGFVWAGAEAAERGAQPPLPQELWDRLRDGARRASEARAMRDGGEILLEIESGAAPLCVRLDADAARRLFVALGVALGGANDA